MNRVVWLFKEQRSGSSWLCNHICNVTELNYEFVERDYQHLSRPERIKTILSREKQDSDIGSLLHTHMFEGLLTLKKYDDPLVIRCSRRNRFEQFLSWYAVKSSNWKFFHLMKTESSSNIGEREVFEDLLKSKIVVPKSEYTEFMNRVVHTSNHYWELAKNYDNQTIFYEDMLIGGFDIPMLNMHDIHMDQDVFLKNPDSYKKEIFINYDEVKEWFDE